MHIKSIDLNNVKSFYPDEQIFFDKGLNIFVGSNASGKTNLFEILQGILNEVIFKHITLDYKQPSNNEDQDKYIEVKTDSAKWQHIQKEILDKHILHKGEEGYADIELVVTIEDIVYIKSILDNRDTLIEEINKKFIGNNVALTSLFEKVPPKYLDSLKHPITYKVRVDYKNIECEVLNLPKDEAESKNFLGLYELVTNLEVLHEISNTLGYLSNSKVKYFPPNRSLIDIRSDYIIDLGTNNSLSDDFSKDRNYTRRTNPNHISSAIRKLAMLDAYSKQDVITYYKSKLKSYLNIDLTIKKDEIVKHKDVYNIKFKHFTNQKDFILSSGECELINLLTGIILSELENGILFIDEPELHLHYQWQEKLLYLLLDIAKEKNIQIFISTHSTKFINSASLSSIFRVTKHGNYSTVIKPEESDINQIYVKNLIRFVTSTNSEHMFFSRKLIIVEGIEDQIIVSKLLSLWKDIDTTDIGIITAHGNKNSLLFRKFVNLWGVSNYIIFDRDTIPYLLNKGKKYLKGQNLITYINENKESLFKAFVDNTILDNHLEFITLLKTENILLLTKENELSSYFKHYSNDSDKLDNALKIASCLNSTENLDKEIKDFLSKVVID